MIEFFIRERRVALFRFVEENLVRLFRRPVTFDDAAGKTAHGAVPASGRDTARFGISHFEYLVDCRFPVLPQYFLDRAAIDEPSSFLLVIFLSWLYFSYGNIPAVKNVFSGITPAITALIVTVAIGMTRKTIKLPAQWVLCLLAALLLIFIGGFTVTFLLIISSGIVGGFLFRQSVGQELISDGEKRTGSRQLMTSGIVLLLLLCILLWGGQYPGAPEGIQIVSTFSGISLTLFGGGYVVIPALHELFVENLNWLTSAEFADGIAIGQITPGPIFITATFIGYKVAGITGALLATLAMFTPPAVLTVLLSRFVKILNQSSVVKAAMKGVRAAVIGMIFASAVTIGQTIMLSVVSAIIFLVTFFISLKYTISPVYLIIGAGVAGFILF